MAKERRIYGEIERGVAVEGGEQGERVPGAARDRGEHSCSATFSRRAARPGAGNLSRGLAKAKRMLGNFPQAFTHVSLVNTACNLAMTASPARHRGEDDRASGMGALPKMPKSPRKPAKPTVRGGGLISRLRG